MLSELTCSECRPAQRISKYVRQNLGGKGVRVKSSNNVLHRQDRAKKRRDSRNLLAITTIRVFNGTFQRDKSKAITEYNKKYPHVFFL